MNTPPHSTMANLQSFEYDGELGSGLICPPPSPVQQPADRRPCGRWEEPTIEDSQKKTRETIEFLMNLHKEKDELSVQAFGKKAVCVEAQVMHAYIYQEIFCQMKWNPLCYSGDAEFKVQGEFVYLGSMEQLLGLEPSKAHDHETKQMSYIPEVFQKFMGGGPWPKDLFFTGPIHLRWNNDTMRYSVAGKYGLFGGGKATSGCKESSCQAN